MPRNRSDVARDVKVDEILAVADEILRRDGFAGLSLADVARRLGLARAAVYWYFPTKDDLLVAVVTKAFAEVMTPRAARGDHVRRIVDAVDRLAELQPLTAALHERAPRAEQAATLAATVQNQLCARLREVLAGHVDEDRLEQVASAIVVFAQGLLAHPRPERERRALLRFLIDRLVPA